MGIFADIWSRTSFINAEDMFEHDITVTHKPVMVFVCGTDDFISDSVLQHPVSTGADL